MGKATQPKQKRQKPQRSCIVCRQKTDKQQLTRIVKTADCGVIIDHSGKQNGRGAYLCSQPSCWDAVVNNTRILDQALKTKVTTDDITAIAAHRPAATGSDERS